MRQEFGTLTRVWHIVMISLCLINNSNNPLIGVKVILATTSIMVCITVARKVSVASEVSYKIVASATTSSCEKHATSKVSIVSIRFWPSICASRERSFLPLGGTRSEMNG